MRKYFLGYTETSQGGMAEHTTASSVRSTNYTKTSQGGMAERTTASSVRSTNYTETSQGGMAERTNALVLKTSGLIAPRVQIPVPPPLFCISHLQYK